MHSKYQGRDGVLSSGDQRNLNIAPDPSQDPGANVDEEGGNTVARAKILCAKIVNAPLMPRSAKARGSGHVMFILCDKEQLPGSIILEPDFPEFSSFPSKGKAIELPSASFFFRRWFITAKRADFQGQSVRSSKASSHLWRRTLFASSRSTPPGRWCVGDQR